MRKPLSTTHGDGGSVYSEGVNRPGFLDAKKCVRLTRMSHQSHKLLQKILGAVPGYRREDLSDIWGGGGLWSLEKENAKDFERQNTIGKAINSALAMEENDVTHEKMIEFEPLLETSGERNLRSINLTHGECPCQCLAETICYPELSNLCLIWDVEEIRSVGLPSHQPVEGHSFSYEHDAGVAMDRGERDETSRVESTNSGVNTCH